MSLANHISALKRDKQNKKKCIRNKTYRTLVKSAAKNVLEVVEENDKENAAKVLKEASKAISKAASKGVIHKRTASRKISGLAKRVNQVLAAV